jgi:hypothetical protein
MAHALQVGVKTTLGLDVGMADKIADLRLFAAKIAFFAHDILRIWKFSVITCGMGEASHSGSAIAENGGSPLLQGGLIA